MEYFSRGGGLSIEKARAVLGYAPRVSFEDGMEHSREWAEQNGLLS
jgi:nucleoside-diphosphate-sugar epimerase